jgi:hypothetical protein
MTQILFAEKLLGDLAAPEITPLGSLDNVDGTDGLALDADRPSTVHAIIYANI